VSRLILYIILLVLIYWVVKRALFPPKGKAKGPEEIGEEMIQDPVCQCYVSKRHSYAVSIGGKKLFFCSEECYRKYMSSNVLPKT